IATKEQASLGGRLGSVRSVRRKLWERLREYQKRLDKQPNAGDKLERVKTIINLIWNYPLKESAQESIARQMRLGISDDDLLDMLIRLREEDKLCEVNNEASEPSEPQIICSIGLIEGSREDD
ncbi:MAG: hypothetical protein ACK419_06730, partial [Pyrinomonadaceae bacterium]